MNGDSLEFDFLPWPVVVICWYLLNPFKHIHPMDDKSKDGKVTIQLSVRSIRDEELATCKRVARSPGYVFPA